MKKTFRTILAGALALLTVSCYDDSALREDLKGLDERVTAIENTLNAEVGGISNLATRLATAETTLASLGTTVNGLSTSLTALDTKVAGLVTRLDATDGKVDGVIKDLEKAVAELKEADKTLSDKDLELAAEVAKIAVVKVEKKAGSAVLTLADGTTVELSMPLANVDNSGLVTVVEVEGVKYWATVGADGAATSLDVPVGHPDYVIAFEVAEDGKLMYTVNGGAAQETGVSTSDISGQKYMITEVEENETNVVITIGEAQYTFPKYVATDAVLSLSRTNFFLRYEGSKTIDVTLENLSDVYVMSKPDGWKAVLTEGKLVVTAPTKKAIEIGAAEQNGLVLIHGNDDNGKCVIGKLDVNAGPGLTLSVDAKGNVVIENSYYSETSSEYGDASVSFSDFIFGLATPEDFNADPAGYIGFYNSNYSAPNENDLIFPSLYNIADGGIYEEGVYETDTVRTTISEAYYKMTYNDLPAGTHYVVWAAPVVGDGKAVIEDVVYTEYVHLVHDVAVKEVSHSDVVLTADCKGGMSYIINAVSESYYNSEYNPMTFEDYMMAPMGGPWTAFVNYGAPMMLGMQVDTVAAEFKLSDVLGEKLAFGENYKVWVMPLVANKTKIDEANSYPEEDFYAYDYSAYDFKADFLPYVIDVKTNDIVAGGTCAATYTLKSNDFQNINVTVTLAEGTESVYYAWYSAADYAEFENEAAVMEAVLLDCSTPLTESGDLKLSYKNPGESWVLASFSVGTDGKYGSIVEQTFSTKALPKNADIKVTLTSVTKDGTNYIIEVAVEGATRVIGYNITPSSNALATFEKNSALQGAKASYVGYQFADVVEGKATLTVAEDNYKKGYYVNALTIADNAVSGMAETVLVIENLATAASSSSTSK